MPKIEFGKPHLRTVKRVQKFELKGVAFVKGYEKAVGFTFECGYVNYCKMKIDTLYQANEVYKFFSTLFKNCSEETGMQKSNSTLSVEWNIADGRLQEVLDRIETAMGTDWKESFKTIFFVYKNMG